MTLAETLLTERRNSGNNVAMTRKRNAGTVRLWWKCNRCAYKIDTFGHKDVTVGEERIMAHDNRVHVHLAEHGVYPDTYTEVAEQFTFLRSTSRVVKRSNLVPEVAL